MLGPTLILYVLVGVAVAGALYLSERSAGSRWFRLVLVLPFWPLFLPLLLGRQDASALRMPPALDPRDELALAIGQTEVELESALRNVRDWLDAEGLEKRTDALRNHWRARAVRIRDMDRLLAENDPVGSLPADGIAATPLLAVPGNDRLRVSRQARQTNLEKLRQVRDEAYGELLGQLAWVREAVSRVILARFSGGSKADVRSLVEQLFLTGNDPAHA